MEVDSIDRDNGTIGPIVKMRPSNEGGVFVTQFGYEAKVGYLLRLSGVDVKDVLRLEAGEKDALDSYLHPDPERPGTYQLVDCRGHLMTGEMSSAGCTDNLVAEYTPFVTEP